MDQDFSELIRYLDRRFDKIDNSFKELKEDFNNFRFSVDACAKKTEDSSREIVSLSRKIDRYEK